jgi:hypothetical protein
MDSLVRTYLGYRREDPDAVAVVRALAAPEALPALVHCTVGKDRTGVAIAVLLSALGVVPDEIAADYAAGAEDIEAAVYRLRSVAANLDMRPATLYRVPSRCEALAAEIFGARQPVPSDAPRYTGVHMAALQQAHPVARHDVAGPPECRPSGGGRSVGGGGVLLASVSRDALLSLAVAFLEIGFCPQLASTRSQLLSLAALRSNKGVLVDVRDAHFALSAAIIEVQERAHCPLLTLGRRPQPVEQITAELHADIKSSHAAAITGSFLASTRGLTEPRLGKHGPLVLDRLTHEVTWRGAAISVTRDQFRILSVLLHGSGAVVPVQQLALAVHAALSPGDTEAIRAHMGRLRKRLAGHVPEAAGLIVTVPGAGYRLSTCVEMEAA